MVFSFISFKIKGKENKRINTNKYLPVSSPIPPSQSHTRQTQTLVSFLSFPYHQNHKQNETDPD